MLMLVLWLDWTTRYVCTCKRWRHSKQWLSNILTLEVQDKRQAHPKQKFPLRQQITCKIDISTHFCMFLRIRNIYFYLLKLNSQNSSQSITFSQFSSHDEIIYVKFMSLLFVLFLSENCCQCFGQMGLFYV